MLTSPKSGIILADPPATWSDLHHFPTSQPVFQPWIRPSVLVVSHTDEAPQANKTDFDCSNSCCHFGILGPSQL